MDTHPRSYTYTHPYKYIHSQTDSPVLNLALSSVSPAAHHVDKQRTAAITWPLSYTETGLIKYEK